MKKHLIYSILLIAVIQSCIVNNKKNTLFPLMRESCQIEGLSIYPFNEIVLGDDKFAGFKITITPWDSFYLKSKTPFKILNGYIWGDANKVYFKDSISGYISVIFSFDSSTFSNNVIYTKCPLKKVSLYTLEADTVKVDLRDVFFSRRYNSLVFPFILHNTDFYFENDNLTFFVGPEKGILGITSSVLNKSGVGPTEIIYTYTGDPFPYWYELFETVDFQDKMGID